MKIGIVSDSHGEAARLERAMGIFAAHGAEAIIHCGDVGGDTCLRLLAAAEAETYVVAGNMDRRLDELSARAEELGIHFSWEVIEVPLGDGRHLVATHGHDGRVLGELVCDHQFPYVCHGHTHKPRDERTEGIRIINPGALHRAKVPTIAVLDTETDMLEHVLVPGA